MVKIVPYAGCFNEHCYRLYHHYRLYVFEHVKYTPPYHVKLHCELPFFLNTRSFTRDVLLLFSFRDLTQFFLIPSAFRRVVCILVADVRLDKAFICVTVRILNDQASIIATIMARIRTTIGAIISARAETAEDLSSFRLSVKFPPHRQTVSSVV